jgi:hypothetical protein
MLQCYVLTFGRSVTAFSALPRSQHPGQVPRSPHPKAGPGVDPRDIVQPASLCQLKMLMTMCCTVGDNVHRILYIAVCGIECLCYKFLGVNHVKYSGFECLTFLLR